MSLKNRPFKGNTGAKHLGFTHSSGTCWFCTPANTTDHVYSWGAGEISHLRCRFPGVQVHASLLMFPCQLEHPNKYLSVLKHLH